MKTTEIATNAAREAGQITIDPHVLGGVSAADSAKAALLTLGCRLDPARDRLWIVPAGKIRAARGIARENNYPSAFTVAGK